jgi:hypothetical protein
MNPLALLALLGIGGLLLTSSKGTSAQPGKVTEPLPPGGVPSQGSAPPILANGTLGHTGQPAGLFWGLPMDVIWKIDNAYYAGDPNALMGVANFVATIPGFEGLAGLIRTDAKNMAPKATT